MQIDLNKDVYDGGEELENSTNNSAKAEDISSSFDGSFVIEDQLDKKNNNEVVGIAFKRENARSKIAFLYVSSFLAIILVSFAFSVYRNLEVDGVKDLLLAVSGILSGPLGFIIGYYFKVEEDNK